MDLEEMAIRGNIKSEVHEINAHIQAIREIFDRFETEDERDIIYGIIIENISKLLPVKMTTKVAMLERIKLKILGDVI